jgi:glycosyltransferase involved in cell wall biosynthesis
MKHNFYPNETAPVSVIIPCYNSEKTLGRAVKSVARQTLRPAELVLVDDGSTDSTVKCMCELQKLFGKDWIIIIELGEDLGVSTARNTGWNYATQKYVAFLDSDDAWHQEKIKIQYTTMENNPRHIMSGHDYKIVKEPFQSYDLPIDYKIEEYSFIRQLFKNYFVTPSVMILRDSRIKFQAGRSDMDDHLLLLELAYEYGPALKIDLPLTFLFKKEWGVSGLSSRLWVMEKGNLKNFIYLYKKKIINLPLCLIMLVLSLLRYQRRLLIKYIFSLK